MSDPSRRYTEAEMRDVFARAARSTPVAPPADGFTLDELQRIGASAGLDPAQVAAAVASLDRPAEEGRLRFGMRTTVERRRVLAAAFNDAEWEEAVAYLRGTYGGPGTSGQVGGIREWTSAGPYSGGGNRPQVHVAARPTHDGMTEVSLEYLTAKTWPELVVVLSGMFAAFGLFFPVGMGLVAGKWGIPAAFGAALLAFAAALFFSLRAYVVRQFGAMDRRFDASIDRLDLIARQDLQHGRAHAHAAPSGAHATPALDLDALNPAPDAPSDERAADSQSDRSRTV